MYRDKMTDAHKLGHVTLEVMHLYGIEATKTGMIGLTWRWPTECIVAQSFVGCSSSTWVASKSSRKSQFLVDRPSSLSLRWLPSSTDREQPNAVPTRPLGRASNAVDLTQVDLAPV